jgi:hypothetical protein
MPARVMTRVRFDFAIRPGVVQSDRERLNIAELDERGLRGFARGRIFVAVDKPRELIVIETEVLDYLDQLKGVVDQLDSGNHETFAVSGDYFSNNLRFTLDPTPGDLEIYDANGGDFRIVLPYKSFRSSFLAFYKKALADFCILYPELAKNDWYRAIIERSE